MHLPAEWAARLPSALAALVAAIAIGWLGGNITALRPNLFVSPLVHCAADFFYERGRDRIRARGGARHAFQRCAYGGDGERCGSVAGKAGGLSVSTRSCGPRIGASSDYLALALFGACARARGACERAGRDVLAGGRHRDLGSRYHAVARCARDLHTQSRLRLSAWSRFPGTSLCATRNPDFIHIFIFQHNFERYLTPMFQHRQPFWYFVPILILGIAAVDRLPMGRGRKGWRLWRERAGATRRDSFSRVGLSFPFCFLAFSQSKLPGYILPAIRPLALLIAIGLQRRVLTHRPTAPEALKMRPLDG